MFFFLQSKCDFYIENQFLFRKLKRELEKSAPAETLQVIQQTVDLNVCDYLYLLRGAFHSHINSCILVLH